MNRIYRMKDISFMESGCCILLILFILSKLFEIPATLLVKLLYLRGFHLKTKPSRVPPIS
jgi:hypothetical protein